MRGADPSPIPHPAPLAGLDLRAALPRDALPRDARPARRIYAIGDIHGMDALLARLLDAIAADAARDGVPYDVIFLGDLVNRGPASKAVIDRLLAGPGRPDCQWIVLRGNHEQAMLAALTGEDPQAFRAWIKRGGMQTLLSYGGTRADATPQRARALVGARHIAFLASLPYSLVAGAYLFVHAGVAPGVPLAAQSPETLMNIRGAFLRKRHGLPYVVVHGHTPTGGKPEIGRRRIGIDSGACVTGVLTAVALDPAGSERRFLQVAISPPA